MSTLHQRVAFHSSHQSHETPITPGTLCLKPTIVRLAECPVYMWSVRAERDAVGGDCRSATLRCFIATDESAELESCEHSGS
jgi:hypothetical protein